MSLFNQLVRQIRQHLFVVCPNNSGSTLLKNLLSRSQATWGLQHEGQKTFGFVGPQTRTSLSGCDPAMVLPPLVWAAEPAWVNAVRDVNRYDWPKTQQAWYLQALSRAPETASVFVEKSPFSVVNVAALKAYFGAASFIFMVRNPYAVVEGIARRRGTIKQCLPDTQMDIFEVAARHIIECLRWQRRNVEQYADDGVFFSYESLCENPQDVQWLIQSRVPRLQDLDLKQSVAVKGLYHEPLRNMNQDQIRRLTPAALASINRVFEPEQALLDYFGYELLDGNEGMTE